jgi:S-methylmethionine-dependent homocysteine/selenocysteine methylase
MASLDGVVRWPRWQFAAPGGKFQIPRFPQRPGFLRRPGFLQPRLSAPPFLPPDDLSTRLSDGPVLLDGGLGQELIHRGMPDTEPLIWSANALTKAPGLVQEVHEDYLRAGADVITTNTYATPPERLSEAGLGEEAEVLNREAGRLAERARAAVGRDVLIAGSLPPIRGSYRPDLVGEAGEIEPQYRDQAGYLAPHVDIFVYGHLRL